MSHRAVVACCLGMLVLGCGGLGSLLRREPARQGITISTAYPGASPAEVEQGVTVPIETSVIPVEGVTGVESLSVEGASVVTAWYDPRASDVWALRSALLERVLQAQDLLPAGAESAMLGSADHADRLLTRIGLWGSEGWRTCARETAAAALTVPGVERAVATGLDTQRLAIQVDPARLAAFDLGSEDVQRALRSTAPHPSGALIRVIPPAPLHAPEDLGHTVVAQRDEVPIRLSDLASISLERTPDAPRVLMDGQPAALLSFYRLPTAKGAEVQRALGEAMDAAEARCAAGVRSVDLAPSARVLAVELELPGAEAVDLAWAEQLAAIGSPLEPSDLLVELGRPAHPALRTVRPERARLLLRFDPAPAPELLARLLGSLRGIPELAVLGWEGPGSRAELLLRGEERAPLAAVADSLGAALRATDPLSALHDGRLAEEPELRVHADRERLGAYGLSQRQLAQAVRASMGCLDAGQVAGPEGDTIPVVLCSSQQREGTAESLLQAGLRTPDGLLVPLGAVAEVQISAGPAALQRVDLYPALRLRITSTEPSERRLRDTVLETISRQVLPAGVSVELGPSG